MKKNKVEFMPGQYIIPQYRKMHIIPAEDLRLVTDIAPRGREYIATYTITTSALVDWETYNRINLDGVESMMIDQLNTLLFEEQRRLARALKYAHDYADDASFDAIYNQLIDSMVG